MPKASVLESWAADVPADFKFVLKAPQRITHMQRLKDAGDSVSYLLKVAGALKEQLGPLLFQLPPFLKKDVPRLREFLALLPPEGRAAFEFRHESWFDQEVFALLRDRRVALCIAEADGDLEVPFESTADWGYLRLRRPDYSDADLKTRVDRVRQQNWRMPSSSLNTRTKARDHRWPKDFWRWRVSLDQAGSARFKLAAYKSTPPKHPTIPFELRNPCVRCAWARETNGLCPETA